jgi:succinate dehydrogenase / fumarate reductase membrane anchor subunit
MSFRTPVKQARGLGSARSGVRHWWMQRVTAIALIPLGVWFAASFIALLGADYVTVTAWLSNPLNAVLTAVLVAVMFQHSWLGVQVVVEDYVHAEGVKIASLLLLKFIHVLLAVYGVFVVLSIAFGS